VKRLLQSVAVFLLALWLPATLHCDLEAAALWLDHGEHAGEACCVPSMGCTHDGCDTLEGGALKLTDSPARVPLPALHACICLICATPPPADNLAATGSARAADSLATAWVPRWHFVRRAAPLSRAPALLVG